MEGKMVKVCEQHSNGALNSLFAEQEMMEHTFAWIKLTLQFSSDRNSLEQVLGRRMGVWFQNRNPIHSIPLADEESEAQGLAQGEQFSSGWTSVRLTTLAQRKQNLTKRELRIHVSPKSLALGKSTSYCLFT